MEGWACWVDLRMELCYWIDIQLKGYFDLLDVFKEGAEAWLQRIKSPLIGSIVLAFAAINWKAIFFVVFSDSPILVRFWYFDSKTTLSSLLFYPIFFGLVIGLGTPFLNFFGSWIVRWPIEKVRTLQAQSADTVMTTKAELAAKREVASAEFKEAALKNAQATQAIEDAELDRATREELEEKVASSLPAEKNLERKELYIGPLERAVLLRLSEAGGADLSPAEVWKTVGHDDAELSRFYNNYSSNRLQVDVGEVLEKFDAAGITETVENYTRGHGVRLSAKGYRIFDEVIAKNSVVIKR